MKSQNLNAAKTLAEASEHLLKLRRELAALKGDSGPKDLPPALAPTPYDSIEAAKELGDSALAMLKDIKDRAQKVSGSSLDIPDIFGIIVAANKMVSYFKGYTIDPARDETVTREINDASAQVLKAIMDTESEIRALRAHSR
jgi:hypothetical protein